jgi:hypothetical protein
MARIFEVTMFWNEDVIFSERIRNTLAYADYLFIAEANQSHSGQITRDFRVPELLKGLSPEIRKRAIHVPVDLGASIEKNPFVREREVRDAAVLALKKHQFSEGAFNRDDVLVIQDFDEFIQPSQALRLKRYFRPAFFWRRALRLKQRLTYYHLNWVDQDVWTLGLMISGREVLAASFSANHWRHQQSKRWVALTSDFVGWHHSYLGDANFIRNKLDSFAEANIALVKDVSNEQIASALAKGEDLYGRPHRFHKVVYADSDPIPALLSRTDLMLK